MSVRLSLQSSAMTCQLGRSSAALDGGRLDHASVAETGAPVLALIAC